MIRHHPRDDLIQFHRLRIHELRHSHGQQQLVQHPEIIDLTFDQPDQAAGAREYYNRFISV